MHVQLGGSLGVNLGHTGNILHLLAWHSYEELQELAGMSDPWCP